ncbi:MAG: amidohydrolase [Rhodothermales bacterium]|nr:amidohydrolase [Rhodothermales bacterium]MBO6778947.1 amidohydrolase [Rhodothermales bacterium]
MNRFLTLACAVLLTACGPSEQADLVLVGGKVVTVDADVPDGTALAVSGGRILHVGSDSEVRDMIGPETEVIELDGRLAIPGFIEGHGHFMSMGNAKMILDLNNAGTWGDIVGQVEDAVAEAEPGEWILGRGWHQEKWDETPPGSIDGVPTHHTLSEVSPRNPVYLGHASGHAAFANAEAMRLGGISSETPDPAGGEIVRDARGEATGLLRETAQGLVSRARSQAQRSMTEEEAEARALEQARLAAEEALSKGITSFQDAGSGFGTIDRFRRLADEGQLPVRLYVMIRASNERLAENLDAYRMIGYGDHHLTVRSIKRSIDGALGPHGAWLLEPYSDKPESAGLNTSEVGDVTETARLALEHGYQLNVHAIGDRANREVLDIFEAAFGGPDTEDRRWRVEHAQHLHPDDIPRFAELAVIASMQGVHATSDGPWVHAKLGEQRAREGAYVWRTLLDSGAMVTNGTDAPVEDVDPIASYHASVTRQVRDGSRFYPDQAMTRIEALESYTLSNAVAAFEEDLKGSLTPGKLADITVLSADILTIPEDEIRTVQVDYTIVGGDVRFSRR